MKLRFKVTDKDTSSMVRTASKSWLTAALETKYELMYKKT